MENISNLSVLFNILFNGMITVFIVLFLVYIIGKVIIYFFDSDASTNNDDSDLKESVAQKIKDIAGGEAKYNDMMKWAQGSLSEQEISMFDEVMESGNPLSAFFAVKALSYRFNDEQGYQGKMLTGNAPKSDGSKFRSQAEVVQAMSDPRYERDAAYRLDIMEKLERSNINF